MNIEIVPLIAFDQGRAAGKLISSAKVREQTQALLKDRHLKNNLGAMSREALSAYAMNRLETVPDYTRFPELEDIYPERVDWLRGFAQGAKVTLAEAATMHYVAYRKEINDWYHSLQAQRGPEHCSGVLLIGPEGVLGAHSVESGPPPMPKGFRHRPLRACKPIKSPKPTPAGKLVLLKPRTGYIEDWGMTNEKGVGAVCGVSCSTFLDDPIEDTWPVNGFPLLRFATSAAHLAQLYQRYTLHIWGRASQIWADAAGDGVVIEKSFRRIGVRRLEGESVIWCTEGHFESPEMHDFIRTRRLEYMRRMGMHLGSEDNQYFTDCAVRFVHIGELCHKPWGLGYDHMRRILTDHAPFPRAVCRHAGLDTPPYDRTITMDSIFRDLTHNRVMSRHWVPWKKFCCEVPEKITQYPACPSLA